MCIVNRRASRRVTWWTLLGVFFAQLAVAAYACPRSMMMETTGEFMAMPADCESQQSPAGPSALCIAHCTSDQRLVDSQPTFDSPVAVPLIVALFSVTAPDASVAARRPTRYLTSSPSPPPLVFSQRFRI
jgi:hypothetical protein